LFSIGMWLLFCSWCPLLLCLKGNTSLVTWLLAWHHGRTNWCSFPFLQENCSTTVIQSFSEIIFPCVVRVGENGILPSYSYSSCFLHRVHNLNFPKSLSGICALTSFACTSLRLLRICKVCSSISCSFHFFFLG
jgi:hypothetical protein